MVFDTGKENSTNAFRYGFIFANQTSLYSGMTYTTERLSADDLLNILALSANATAVYTTEEIRIETANDKMIAAWQKDRSVIGKTIEEALPEMKDQPFFDILKNVWRTGITYNATAMQADIETNGKMERYYFDFEYRAIKKPDGEILCILHTARDVTDVVFKEQTIRVKESELVKLNRDLVRANRNLAVGNQDLQTLNENLVATQKDMSSMYARLLASEEKFRSVMEQIPVAVNVLSGRELRIELVNDLFLEIWGKQIFVQEAIGKTLTDINPEFIGQPFMQSLDDVYTTGNTFYGHNVPATVMRNGVPENRFYNVIYRAIRDENETINSIVQIAGDNTAEVLATLQIKELNEELAAINEELAAGNEELRSVNEELLTIQNNLVTANSQLSESEERFRNMAESTNVFIGVSDETGNAVYFNKIWSDVTGRSSQDLLQFGWADLVHPEDRDRALNVYRQAIAAHTPFINEFRILTKERKYISLLVEGLVRKNADDSYAGHIGSAFDITERKRDEQRKNDFIGMVSHELKTPLTSLNGYLEIVKMDLKESGNLSGANLLDKAGKQVSKMTTMINGFLNVSRLESGKIQIEKRRFDMAKLVEESKEEVKGLYNNHHIIFEPVEEIWVYADWDKTGHVLNNFISNASKYSPYGSVIKIACTTVDGNAVVAVRDKGMGIAPEDQERLFERYYRVENKTVQSVAGFGIGLYLCAEIIHRNDGNIWVESALGEGSTFYFSLPVVP